MIAESELLQTFRSATKHGEEPAQENLVAGLRAVEEAAIDSLLRQGVIGVRADAGKRICGGDNTLKRHKVVIPSGGSITTWTEPVHGEPRSWDDHLVSVTDERIIVAVADVAYNTANPDVEAKSRHALETVIGNVGELGVYEGLAAAAEMIHDSSLQFRHHNGLVTFAGIEVRDGRADLFRAGDSEVWTRVGDDWTKAFTGDMMAPHMREVYDTLYPKIPERYWWDIQQVVFNDLNAWRSPAVGLADTVNPDYQVLSVAQVDEIVVATDGAGLNPERLSNLEHWLDTEIHVMPERHRFDSPHGDLTVIRWKTR